MAQADGVVANGTGSAVRADINGQLAALFTNHSGSTEPATTFAFQTWADTNTSTLKLRNSSNDGWIQLARLDGQFDAKTFNGNITLNAQSDLRLADSDSSNWVAFQAPATVASNLTWTLPATDGTSGQALTTNGSGTLSWTSPAASTDIISEGNTSAEVVDTGSDGHFKVVTEGTEALRVDSSQRVGIGINSPAQNLHIASTSSTTQRISRTGLADGNASDAAVIEFANGTGAVAELRSGGDGDLQINTRALSTDSYNNSLFVKGSTGNAGIGTTSPPAKLSAHGTGPQLNLYHTSTGSLGANFHYNGTTGALQIATNGNNASSSHQLALDLNANLQFNSGYGSVATAYGVRAWINFNGTGTPSARGSGNVSSVTDYNTGRYIVSFSNAMPDANYCLLASGNHDDAGGWSWPINIPADAAPSTTSVRVVAHHSYDYQYMFVAVIR